MTKRKKILLVAAAMSLCGLAGWQSERAISVWRGWHPPLRVVTREEPRAPNHRAVVAPAEDRAPAGPKATRREAAQLVRALYRKEQLARELALEQRRYAGNYWESPCGGSEGPRLQRERETMLTQLSAEANDVLNDLFPGETGEPVTLTAFFDADRAGPNLAFLSPARRERFEDAMLAGDDGGGVDAERLRSIAERELPAAELEIFREWNAPAAVALRAQLVGFNQTENEFAAILRGRCLAEVDGEAREPDALEAALGAQRFAELQRLQEPARQTAAHELQRLGLPLDHAEWLAATRTRAIAEIGEVWQSAALTDAMKREQVAQLERAYGQTIAAKLGLREATLDGITPNS